MSMDPDVPRTIARLRAHEAASKRAYDELLDELEREPTDDEVDNRAHELLEAARYDYPEDK